MVPDPAARVRDHHASRASLLVFDLSGLMIAVSAARVARIATAPAELAIMVLFL